LVVVPDLAPADELVAMTEIAGRQASPRWRPTTWPASGPPKRWRCRTPPTLLVDPDPGRDWLDVPPAEVLAPMLASGRTPLTLDEGLALLLQDGGLLRSANCFSMLASRCGDKRVPALWVSKNRPRLGWCWNGAPHSWLGSASAAARLG
jgi:hypothetical protein